MRKWFIMAGVMFAIGLLITAVFNSSQQVPLFVGQAGGLLTSLSMVALIIGMVSGIRRWRNRKAQPSDISHELKEAREELALLKAQKEIRELREEARNKANPQRRGRNRK